MHYHNNQGWIIFFLGGEGFGLLTVNNAYMHPVKRCLYFITILLYYFITFITNCLSSSY